MPSPDDLRFLSAILPPLLILFGIGRPVYAAIGYMCLVYCKVSEYYPAYAAIQAELTLGLAVLVLLLVRGDLFRGLSPANNRYNAYLAAFLGCIFLSHMMSWDRQFGWDNAVYHFVKVLVLYGICVGSLTTQRDLKIFAGGFLLLFVYLAYEPIYGSITGTGGSEHMYGTNYIADVGILSGHVALANNMNQMIPVAYFLAVQKVNTRLRVVGILALVVFGIALIGSGSRGGVIGFLAFGFVLFWLSKNKARVAFVVVPLVLVLLLTTQLSQTASRIGEGDSLVERMLGLTHGIGMLQKGNIFGVGPGCYQLARKSYFGWGMQAHNIYGEVIGDLGLPGAIVWVLLIRQIFLNVIRAKRKLLEVADEKHILYSIALGIQASLIVRLIISMASHGLYYFYWYVLAAMSIGLVKAADALGSEACEGEDDVEAEPE